MPTAATKWLIFCRAHSIKLGIEKEILNTMNLKLKTNYGKIEVPKDLSGSKESNEDNDTQSYEKTL